MIGSMPQKSSVIVSGMACKENMKKYFLFSIQKWQKLKVIPGCLIEDLLGKAILRE